MSRKLFYIGVIFTVLLAAAATPFSVQAEGDPPPNPEPVKPPWITGINPNVSLSTEPQEELTPGGVADLAAGVEVPLLAAPPDYVDLDPQESVDPSLNIDPLAVPQRYQDPLDNTCGAAALGMALEFLSLNGEGSAPSLAALVSDLKNSGLLYETGTGVEELAFLARQHGYQGTSAFHDWPLAQLREQLEIGKPVVVSLGSNGEKQAGHFVTLTGISTDGKWVSYNDPILGKQTVPVDEFQKLWDLQGNSGLVASKEPLSVADDPMLPWMGLFSAMAVLAVMAKQYPLGNELTSTVEQIRNLLSNPIRKGLAGKLIAEGGSSSAPPYPAPPGYHWTKTSVPRYGWKDVQVTEKVQVPNIVKTYGVIRTNHWVEKVAVYRTVKKDYGHWAYRTVTKYRTERYRTTERYKTTKYYWYRRNGRLVRGSYDVWKTRTVVKTRRVPYSDREKYWVPKIVFEKQFDHYREIEHHDPVYGWKEEVRGTRTVERTKTTRAWAPVGTKIEWELKKDPASSPTPTPYNPTPTATPKSEQATTTAAPFYPTAGSTSTATPYPTLGSSMSNSQIQSSTATATPWPTMTQSATPSDTPTSTPTATPTSLYNYIYYGTNTPAPTGTPVPIGTKIAEIEDNISEKKTLYKGLKQILGIIDKGAPTNYQLPGLVSTALKVIGIIGENQGAPDNQVKTVNFSAKVFDSVYPIGLARAVNVSSGLPTAGEILGQAVQTAAKPGVANPAGTALNTISKCVNNQLSAIGEKVVPTLSGRLADSVLANYAVRSLQAGASLLGMAAGVFQINDGVKDLTDEDRYDNWIGATELIGGAATIAGSAITFGAAVGAIATGTALVGAAPILLGVGAITAGGALLYELGKDTPFVNDKNQKIESWANEPEGFVDTAISIGQSYVADGVSPALAIAMAIDQSIRQQINQAVMDPITKAVDGVSNFVSNLFRSD